MKNIKPNNGEPFHQAEFECACGVTGHIQTTKETVFCPTCGSSEGIEVWESEFVIVEGELTTPQPEMLTTPVKIVYKDRIVYRTKPTINSEKDGRFGFRGKGAYPTTGHRGRRKDPNHKIVNDPPVITSILGEDGKREYSVDCGYTGQRSTITHHLQTWHGMSHREANQAVKIRNHEWQDRRHRLLVHDCTANGLNPVSVQFLGYVKNLEGQRLYRYHIPECGFTGARTSLLRHLTIHHGYDLDTAKLMSKVRGIDTLADKTHVNKFLEVDPLQWKETQ